MGYIGSNVPLGDIQVEIAFALSHTLAHSDPRAHVWTALVRSIRARVVRTAW